MKLAALSVGLGLFIAAAVLHGVCLFSEKWRPRLAFHAWAAMLLGWAMYGAAWLL